MLKRATHVSKSSALFRRRVRTITVAKKTRSSSHLMHNDVAQLLGWHVSQSGQQFCYDEFFFLLPFISLLWTLVFMSGLSKFSCAFYLYLFWVWSSTPWNFYCFDFNASWTLFFSISSLSAFNLIYFLYLIWSLFFWLLFFLSFAFILFFWFCLLEF